jgi:hypothetical protein
MVYGICQSLVLQAVALLGLVGDTASDSTCGAFPNTKRLMSHHPARVASLGRQCLSSVCCLLQASFILFNLFLCQIFDFFFDSWCLWLDGVEVSTFTPFLIGPGGHESPTFPFQQTPAVEFRA